MSRTSASNRRAVSSEEERNFTSAYRRSVEEVSGVTQLTFRRPPSKGGSEVPASRSHDSLASSPSAMLPRLAFTPEEAAATIGVSRTRMFQLLRSGEIPSLKLGRVRRVRIDRLREYLEQAETDQWPHLASGAMPGRR